MAIMDRIRERLMNQRPMGAATGIRNEPTVEPDELADADLELMTMPRTAEAAEAGIQGARAGAESIMEMAGVIPLRRRELMDQNRIMNAERLNEATQLLLKYQAAKSSVNERIVNAQQWWKLKNWEEIRKNRGVKGATAKPTNTGWLWNCIVGKHADAIDSFPEPIILPRMEDDKAEAQKLSKIVPVVMEMNDFEQTYNDCSWQKMQEGTGVYGIFWNSRNDLPERLTPTNTCKRKESRS